MSHAIGAAVNSYVKGAQCLFVRKETSGRLLIFSLSSFLNVCFEEVEFILIFHGMPTFASNSSLVFMPYAFEFSKMLVKLQACVCSCRFQFEMEPRAFKWLSVAFKWHCHLK